MRWTLFFLSVPLLVAQQGGIAPPSYQPFRYDEDWSSLADGSPRADRLDPLKYIRLKLTGWYVTLAGEVRERFELLDEPGFGTGPEDKNGYLLQRYLLSADFHLGERFRAFVELQSGLEAGRKGGPRPTDVDTLGIHQGFFDWRLARSAKTNITLRAGRQEVGFGSGRLISPAEGLNVRRSFDGVRLMVTTGKLVWNATALRLVQTSPGIFEDTPDHRQTYWGAGIVAPSPVWKGSHVALHYHGRDRKKSVFEKGAGRSIRQTVGLRVWNNRGPWDHNYEGFAQWGSFSGKPVRAWALSQDTGYTLKGWRLRPRFGFRADITSGDHGRRDRALRSFDPLFPATPVYSGPSALLGSTNLMDITPNIRIPFKSTVSVTVESSSFWRQSLEDGIYGPSIAPVRLGGSNPKRYVATAPSATVGWQANRHASASVVYTHFFTGAFFEMARPARDVNYVSTTLTYRF